MLRLTMMPADDGDCLLLEYGTGGSVRRILIDGGRAGTYPLIRPRLAGPDGKIDLLVVTHVDQDHILGVLAMLADEDRPVRFDDVWFNGYDHLLDAEGFGAQDGEQLTTALVAQNIPWNAAFSGRSIEVGRPFTWFDDGSSLTLLSPDRAQLEKLAPAWVKECARHGLIPGKDPVPAVPGFESFGSVDIDALTAAPFTPDKSKTNVTSIGFLFEYDGKRIIFTGDADDRRLASSLRPLAAAEGGRLRVDALKVAHHGSDNNLSTDLLDLLDCNRYLISTSGARHAHPNEVAMARILKHGGPDKQLVFNYRQRAALWDVEDLRSKYHYTVVAPPETEDGFVTIDF
jgi:beta-lactamase superfamily II metal-dependent hydrolase